MSAFLLLSDSSRHPVQFPVRTFDLALRLLLLRGVHLRQSFGKPAAGTPQNGERHLQIALDLFGRGWLRCPALALAHESLRLADLFGNLRLAETGTAPRLAKDLEEYAITRGMNRFFHCVRLNATRSGYKPKME